MIELTAEELECARASICEERGAGWSRPVTEDDFVRERALRLRNEAQLREAITVARAFIEEVVRERVNEGQNNGAIRVLCYIDDCPALEGTK